MKTILLILLLALILYGSMQSFGQGINGSLNYQDFSKSELTLAELSLLTKIQLAGEHWYYQAKSYKVLYDLEFIKNGQLNAKELIRLSEIQYWQNTAEENKPSWLQHPITITAFVILAFAGGLAVAL